MEWEKLLSLKRHGDEFKRKRIVQDETRLGFEVDYDRIIFSSEFRTADLVASAPVPAKDGKIIFFMPSYT